ncbi:BTB/POZ domain-containing protein 2-like [Gigantopelta aegis]|uniref:BTB/POZ domain-containing protein 2-like n=1 Tax=Gigantopelta aegis TaxID=1735272 RepID=UPI001B88E332|nr:BTB/POZ domain-containing protein 2-like [Gigantopelta aegis]XP_041373896.1 BTB/POZ domain-containing protein 2-like [Gigantopelta aegis]XP_041373897.1 BTB/POZ domain-containing protein 2-like [Gigantopelta aegis]XP_041373898.1 BTB/POZ domain-containing protein 2-like [Gigantopelta aegis]XP_041373899.1 BTB/POZ domain-containing protein 2-like [Gigantopelta aegis]
MAAKYSETKSGFADNWQRGKSLIECLRYSLQQKSHCDVTFQVGKDRKSIPAHRLILTLRSRVFEAMLTGPLAEQENIALPDIETDIFEQFLIFLYTDGAILDSKNAIGLLYLSKKYDVTPLEQKCVAYLESSISSHNACVVMEQAHFYDEHDLKVKAMKYICENGNTVLKSPGFTDLCHSCVLEITETDELVASEEKVFEAVNAWSEAECRQQGREITPGNKRSALGKALMNVRYSLLGQTYFVERVSPNNLLTESEENKIFKNFVSPDKSVLPFKKEPRCRAGNLITAEQFENVSEILYTPSSAEYRTVFCVNQTCALQGFSIVSGSFGFSVFVCDEDTGVSVGKTSGGKRTGCLVEFPKQVRIVKHRKYSLVVRFHKGHCVQRGELSDIAEDGNFACRFLNNIPSDYHDHVVLSLVFRV